MTSAGKSGRGLARNAAMLTIGSVFTQGATILSISLLARLVSKPEIGTYQQLQLVYGILAPLLLGGIPTALLYFLPRAQTDPERRDWIRNAYELLALTGLLFAGLLVVLRYPIADVLGNNPGLPKALALFAPYVVFAFIASATPSALVAAGRPVAAAIVNAAVGICTLIAVVGAALIRPDAAALAVGLSVAGALWAGISVLAVVFTIGIGRAGLSRRLAWPALARYGAPLAVSGLAGRIGYQFDRIVVAANFSTSAFAIYALGAVEIPIVLLLQQSITNALVPELSTLWRQGDPEGMMRLWREATRKTVLIMVPMFTFLMATAPDAVTVLYGSGYHESVSIFRIYLLLLPFRVATYGVISQATGRTRVNIIAAIIMVVANVVAAVGLVGPLGLQGPAWAAPAATALTVVYYLRWTQKLLSARLRDIFPAWELVQTLLVCALPALAVALLQLTDMPAAVRLVLALALFTPTALLAMRATRLVRDDDWSRLLALIPARARVRMGIVSPD